MAGEWLTRISVWLALLGYLAGPLAAGYRRHDGRAQRAARHIYTAGLIAFLVHVAAAFHVFYDWSHGVALAETARETEAVTGRRTGTGLYLNYLFVLLWLGDVAWWWWAGWRRFRARPRVVDLALHGFFLFMAFNATVVFEQGLVRWTSLAVGVGLVVFLMVQRRSIRNA